MTAFDQSVAKAGFARNAAQVVRATVKSPNANTQGGWGPAQVLIVFVIALLNLIGLAMVLSASSVASFYEGEGTWYHFIRQTMWLSIGIVALLVTRKIPYQRWSDWMPWVLAATFLALLAVLIPGIGVVANGSRRWIGVGGFTVQPTEGLKLAIIIYTAKLLADRAGELDDVKRTLGPPIVVFCLAAALVLRQPDLGTVLVAGGIMLALLFIGGIRLGPLLGLATIGGAMAVGLSLMAPYRRARLLAFIDPWDDPLNTGYQTIQSLVGIASGGLTGVGVGEGRAKWGFLPFAHTDFIYAVVAEEMGFVGAVGILGLFVFLAFVGVRVALHAPDRFGTLMAMGVVVWLVLQALVNIGAVIGVLPITGVPLPFVSFGGTSLVAGMAAIGILLNIGRQARA